jgi:hypothetical protein
MDNPSPNDVRPRWTTWFAVALALLLAGLLLQVPGFPVKWTLFPCIALLLLLSLVRIDWTVRLDSPLDLMKYQPPPPRRGLPQRWASLLAMGLGFWVCDVLVSSRIGPAKWGLFALALVLWAMASRVFSPPPRRKGPTRYLHITSAPTGEAPEWVREKWVGLSLPVAGAGVYRTSGVLTGPHGALSRLVARYTGKLRQESGYRVNALAAIQVLEAAHPDAAAWWRQNAPHLLRPHRCFVFRAGVGEVAPVADGTPSTIG